jgi:hypothetical protein
VFAYDRPPPGREIAEIGIANVRSMDRADPVTVRLIRSAVTDRTRSPSRLSAVVTASSDVTVGPNRLANSPRLRNCR